jgi:hypothetical protein
MGSPGSKIADALKATNDFLTAHQGEFDKIVEGSRIVYDAATKIAQKNKKPVGSVFTGDPVADRALLEAQGIAGTLKTKGIDLELVLALLYKVLEIGGTFMALGKK